MDMPNKFSDDRTFREDPLRFSGVLTFLTSSLVVAILYFARDIIVPITLAILLSFLLSPVVRALRCLQLGRIGAVSITAVISFLIILGFVTVVVQEVSSLARDLPQYRSNLEAKVRSLPDLVPGAGVFRRAADMLQDLRVELARSETHVPAPAERPSPTGNSAETAKPLPVEIRQPDLEPLPLVRSIVGPLLQPLATAGLVVVFVIMILIDWEDLRDRLLRLAGRRDLHRTTEAMNDAAQRVSRYLARQLVVNVTCGVPIGVGLAVIGIPNLQRRQGRAACDGRGHRLRRGRAVGGQRGRPRRRRGTRPPPYRKRSAGKWPDPHSSGVLQNTSETRAGPVF